VATHQRRSLTSYNALTYNVLHKSRRRDVRTLAVRVVATQVVSHTFMTSGTALFGDVPLRPTHVRTCTFSSFFSSMLNHRILRRHLSLVQTSLDRQITRFHSIRQTIVSTFGEPLKALTRFLASSSRNDNFLLRHQLLG